MRCFLLAHTFSLHNKVLNTPASLESNVRSSSYNMWVTQTSAVPVTAPFTSSAVESTSLM
eukprot:1149443-Pelagomonas_calceolata.AAC.4